MEQKVTFAWLSAEQDVDRLQCGICLAVPQFPESVMCCAHCAHAGCRSCFERVRPARCPWRCQPGPWTIIQDHSRTAQVQRLQVECNGCHTRMSWWSWERHKTKECVIRTLQCPMAECKFQGTALQLEVHQQEPTPIHYKHLTGLLEEIKQTATMTSLHLDACRDYRTGRKRPRNQYHPYKLTPNRSARALYTRENQTEGKTYHALSKFEKDEWKEMARSVSNSNHAFELTHQGVAVDRASAEHMLHVLRDSNGTELAIACLGLAKINRLTSVT
jgi:hypothetical protein